MPLPKATGAAVKVATTTTASGKRPSLNGMKVLPLPKSILKKQSVTGKKTHNKRITFHNKKKTKRIPNLNSMPEDILQDIWWSAEDYDDIMRSFEYTVFMMEAGEGKVVDDGEEHCTRGLELRTEAGKWARFEHKRDCYNAVLDEQDRQWNAGEDNQEKIANCCREVTAKTQRIACRKGMQDEKEIVDFVADTRAAIQKTTAGSSGTSPKSGIKKTNSSANGSKTLPSRTKSNSTGQLKRRTPRTDSGKARVEKSPPRKPERVLSGKSERGEVTPTNSATGAAVVSGPAGGAPRTPKRSVSNKSSDNSKKGVAGQVTPTNSAKSNLQRMPQRQTFSNNSNSPPARTNSASAASPAKSAKTAAAKKKSSSSPSGTSPSLPKMPKRSASNSSNASLDSGSSDVSDGKGRLSRGALSKFGG